MDTSTEKFESGEYQLAPLSTVLETTRNMIRRLIDFFTITEEDCVMAGVHIDEEHNG